MDHYNSPSLYLQIECRLLFSPRSANLLEQNSSPPDDVINLTKFLVMSNWLTAVLGLDRVQSRNGCR